MTAVAMADLEERLADSVGARQPIDIEDLVQWALAQTGYLPWRGVSDRELQYDWGYTVVPVGAKAPFISRGVTLRRAINDDANTVIAAIKALEPKLASIVIACGRQRIRPNWLPGIEPKKIAKQITERSKKNGRKHRRKRTVMVWNIDPETVALARQHYQIWHNAMTMLMARLSHQHLEGFRITGFAAPIRPW